MITHARGPNNPSLGMASPCRLVALVKVGPSVFWLPEEKGDIHNFSLHREDSNDNVVEIVDVPFFGSSDAKTPARV